MSSVRHSLSFFSVVVVVVRDSSDPTSNLCHQRTEVPEPRARARPAIKRGRPLTGSVHFARVSRRPCGERTRDDVLRVRAGDGAWARTEEIRGRGVFETAAVEIVELKTAGSVVSVLVVYNTAYSVRVRKTHFDSRDVKFSFILMKFKSLFGVTSNTLLTMFHQLTCAFRRGLVLYLCFFFCRTSTINSAFKRVHNGAAYTYKVD